MSPGPYEGGNAGTYKAEEKMVPRVDTERAKEILNPDS